MSLGYWIVKGDKTTCGGTVLEGHPNGRILGGNRQATSGCKVSCGKHSGTYSVGGGHPGDLIHGQRSASTLYSRSTCPCNAAFIPSMTWAKHGLYQGGESKETTQKQRYIVTIYLAYPGTPLNNDDGNPKIKNGVRQVSAAGHMWYQITIVPDNNNQSYSYGFAPIESGITGRGEISKHDTIHYVNPYYSRTFEITENQYNKLKEFGDTALKQSEIYFSLDYNGVTNSCINFTWKALRHAGLNPPVLECESIHDYCDSGRLALDKKENKFNGEITVGDNQIHVRAIPAPYPDSELNKEIKNPAPTQSMMQKAASGLDPDDYKKPKTPVSESDNPMSNPNYGADQFFGDWHKHSR